MSKNLHILCQFILFRSILGPSHKVRNGCLFGPLLYPKHQEEYLAHNTCQINKEFKLISYLLDK